MSNIWVITGADGPVYQGDAVVGTPSSPSSSSPPPCLHQLCRINTCRGKYCALVGLNYIWRYAFLNYYFKALLALLAILVRPSVSKHLSDIPQWCEGHCGGIWAIAFGKMALKKADSVLFTATAWCFNFMLQLNALLCLVTALGRMGFYYFFFVLICISLPLVWL